MECKFCNQEVTSEQERVLVIVPGLPEQGMHLECLLELRRQNLDEFLFAKSSLKAEWENIKARQEAIGYKTRSEDEDERQKGRNQYG